MAAIQDPIILCFIQYMSEHMPEALNEKFYFEKTKLKKKKFYFEISSCIQKIFTE